MAHGITAGEFRAADGVTDWHVLEDGASVSARFATGSFAVGVDLVTAIGRLADAANHHPDVDLRYAVVTVRLTTHDLGGLSDRDVHLAREITAAARDLDIAAAPDPSPPGHATR
ncbi:MAG: 4a-hydroxytetrahydrobiopterin dehydratase [Nocardioides sp.]|nr:4a-hydroxytetrahydrobiopterin dehydratase [Nocardioides sp.]